jgi:ABC-type Fe3+-siderophore transport system permease subunit
LRAAVSPTLARPLDESEFLSVVSSSFVVTVVFFFFFFFFFFIFWVPFIAVAVAAVGVGLVVGLVTGG